MIQGYFYAVLTAVMWGVAAIMEKKSLNLISPVLLFIVAGIVFGAGSLLTLCFYWTEVVKSIKGLTVYNKCYIVATVLMALVVSNYFYFKAIQSNNQTHIIAALTFSAPLFTLMLTSYFLHQRVTQTNIIGILMIVGGSMILTLVE
jgi:uncharacterized membrane protein